MAADPSRTARHVRLYAMHIADPERYQRYRTLMTPILHRHGGSFRYDFAIAHVLASDVGHPIDRVFTIAFPDRAAADRLFSDPAYLAIRREWFEPAVAAFTVIAAFDEDAAP